MAKYTAIGGQALIEGIMMRSPEKTAMAVRKPDKDIDISYIEEKSLRKRFAFFRIPVIRGIVGFIESMKTGYGAMMKSAEISGFTDLDDEEDKKEDRSADSGESSDTPENARFLSGRPPGGSTSYVNCRAGRNASPAPFRTNSWMRTTLVGSHERFSSLAV